MELKDDIIAILRRFNVVTKQTFLPKAKALRHFKVEAVQKFHFQSCLDLSVFKLNSNVSYLKANSLSAYSVENKVLSRTNSKPFLLQFVWRENKLTFCLLDVIAISSNWRIRFHLRHAINRFSALNGETHQLIHDITQFWDNILMFIF